MMTAQWLSDSRRQQNLLESCTHYRGLEFLIQMVSDDLQVILSTLKFVSHSIDTYHGSFLFINIMQFPKL